MEINKRELESALEIVKPGLANKEVIEQSTSFAFIKGRVIVYNGEISISHPVKGLNIEGAVPADNLYKLLGKIKIKKEEENEPNMDITLTTNELILTKGKMKAGFAIEADIKLPLKEEIAKIGNWKDLPEGFVDFLDKAKECCGRDMSRAILTCVHVSKDGIIEASDSFRVIKCSLKEDMPVEDFLLPASSAIQVIRIKPTQIAIGKGWVHFQNDDGTIISCRTFEDVYPNNPAVFKVTGKEILFPDGVVEVLDKAILFAKRAHEIEEMVEITIANKNMHICAKADTSWYEDNVPINTREELEFKVTPYLLKQIIKENKACIVSKEKLKFEGEGWIYIAALRH